MTLDLFDLEVWSVYLLIFARMAGIVFLFPYFSWQGVPVLLRVFIAIMLAFLVFLAIGGGINYIPPEGPEVVLALMGEVLIGIALGFLVMVFFSIFMMSGEMVSRQAGLMFARVFDPTFGGQVNIMGQFYTMIVVVFYLAINGHHLLLKALTDSFSLIPLGAGMFVPELTGGVVRFSADALIISFQIIAPIIITLMIFNMALGLIAKTVPQIHIFILSLPVKIIGSLFLFLLLLPMLVAVLESLLNWFLQFLYQFMQGWS